MAGISLSGLFVRFKWRISATFLLVVLESALGVLYPLLIGLAIDDLLADSLEGLLHLGLLGIASVLVGSARRLYDTRIYAGIYERVAVELVEQEAQAGASVSRTTARADLLTEFVDFFEDSMPELLGALISLFGILIIVAGLSWPVFIGCLCLVVLLTLIYAVTARRNYRLNAGYNDQYEETVDVITSADRSRQANHFKRLMQWNIRLSDLETFNYAIFWIGAVGLFLFAPYSAVTGGALEAGLILSLLLYVFEFIDWLSMLPLHIQQVIRLREIARRLASDRPAG